MKQIFHPFWLWEDHKEGYYNNCSGKEKKDKIQSVIKMFSSDVLTEKYMTKVVSEWKYSCEHNLTNPSMNQIAYIGQGACCLFDSIPCTITMEAWSLLDKTIQDRADCQALIAIKKWKTNNKNIQLCLNII